MTISVPATSARGSVRRGSRISSARMLALCQPPYEKRIGTRAAPKASSVAAGRVAVASAAAGGSECAQPEPSDDQDGEGADLQDHEHVQQPAARLDADVVDERDEDERERSRAAAGRAVRAPESRRVYCENVIATAARPPPWIMTSEAQPKRKPTTGW